MSIALQGTKEKLEDLSEEFAENYDSVRYPIQYDPMREAYFQVVPGEEGDECQVVEEKYYPIIDRYVNWL